MKLLVFAQTPPPHHGQSCMVQFMLTGLGGDCRGRVGASSPYGIDCYHVDARLSQTIQEIGGFQPRKLVLLILFCLQALWLRFRFGVRNFYYIPAPGMRSALYRDWLVMLVCRPFFKRVILHWHAAGMTRWLETSVPGFARRLTLRLMHRPDLSIVLSQYNRADAENLTSRQIAVVPNGIPDPCPGFTHDLLPRRLARFAARQKLLAGLPLAPEDLQDTGGDPHVIRVLFLAHCSREKGLFDAVEAVARANGELLSSASPLRFCLTVAGEFLNETERREFQTRCQAVDLRIPERHRGARGDSTHAVDYIGFVSGSEKTRIFSESDCFCFPTYYLAENLPLVVIEAMAFGLPIVATRWRSLPELFPPGYAGLVDVRSPAQVSETMLTLAKHYSGQELREVFVRNFTMERHLSCLAKALCEVEQTPGRRALDGSKAEILAGN